MTTKSAEVLAAEEWAYKNNAADWGTLVDPVSGAIDAFLAGRESALKPLREHAEMLNREIVYGRMTDKNCYVDFCNLITMLLTTTKLKKV